jgi:hypothetical protein
MCDAQTDDTFILTPEMATAGETAYEEWSGSAYPYFLVQKIYIAMVQAKVDAHHSKTLNPASKI